MAMDIGKNLYGAALCTGGSIWLEPGTGTVETEASKRINVEYAKDANENLWRFTVKDNRFVSKPLKR
jgi:3-methyladenine DNA glycosylase Mpg